MARVQKTKLFYGFSTRAAGATHRYTVYDMELIKQDLLNHFHTRVGERVMRPSYGCRIWDYLYEPLTPANREIIVAEALRICNSDSRVAVIDEALVSEFDNGLRVQIDLEYRPFNVINTFTIDFERRQTLDEVAA